MALCPYILNCGRRRMCEKFGMAIRQGDIYSNHLRHPWILTTRQNISNESLLHTLSPEPCKNTSFRGPCKSLLTVPLDDDTMISDIFLNVMQAPSWLSLLYLSISVNQLLSLSAYWTPWHVPLLIVLPMVLFVSRRMYLFPHLALEKTTSAPRTILSVCLSMRMLPTQTWDVPRESTRFHVMWTK